MRPDSFPAEHRTAGGAVAGVGTAARVAALAGLAFGALSVVAGARVLAGLDRPDYVVLRPLVLYNVAAGVAGIVAGAGLWRLRNWAVGLSRALAALHGTVLAVLAATLAAGGPVAAESLAAMLARTAVWTAIAMVASRAARHRRS